MITDNEFLAKIIELADYARGMESFEEAQNVMESIIQHVNAYRANPKPKTEQDKNSLSALCQNNINVALKKLNKAHAEKNPSIMKELIGEAINNVDGIRNKLGVHTKIPKKSAFRYDALRIN